MPEKVTIAHEGADLVVRISGALDASAVPRVGARVDEALAEVRPRSLLLDLSGVTFTDSTGLGMLVGFRNECHAHGVDLVLLDVSRRVRRMFEITGLHTVFRIEESSTRSA